MVLVHSTVGVSLLQSGDEPKLTQLRNLNEVGKRDMNFGEVTMNNKKYFGIVTVAAAVNRGSQPCRRYEASRRAPTIWAQHQLC